jgi:uncharacterized protein with ParB-like and HNH nuclease domain
MTSDLQRKAKERTVKSQNIEYDLETLVKKINRGVIELDPDYQRRHRWSDEFSSKLIESLILNIPIPIIYISQNFDADTETDDPRFSVIDGQQRLTAIKEFFNNSYRLCGLESLSELNGSTYKELPPFLKRRLEERTIKCLRIDSTVDAQVKLDIFERLNSGSVKLEPQELRNATQSGEFNELCKRLAKNEVFRKIININPDAPEDSSKIKKMEDVELVLRFYALKDGRYKEYNQKQGYAFKDFLTEALEEANNLSLDQRKDFEVSFNRIVKIVNAGLGETPFAKYRVTDSNNLKRQSKFNSAVYDSIMVGVNDSGIDVISPTKKESLLSMFRNDEYFQSVSGSTNNSSKINFRINHALETINK